MSEPEKRDHWADLAESMGLPTPPPEEKKAEPTAPPAAVPTPERAARVKSESRPRPPADWSRLAFELGLAPPPPPPPPSPPPPPPPPVEEPESAPAAELPEAEAFLAEPEASEPEPIAPAPAILDLAAEIDVEAIEEARARAEVWESQRVEVSDPVFLDTSEAEEAEEAVWAEASAESTQAEAEPRKRRRKRRRRKRPAEGPEARTESVPADAGPAEQYLEEVLAAPTSEPDEETEEGEEEDEAQASASSERRDGRKRRRRRKKRRPEPAASDEPSNADDSESWAEPGDASDEAEDLHEGEADEGDESSGKLSHRAIPTWDQAVGLIISCNLDARAKNPNGGGPRRGKGRRGR